MCLYNEPGDVEKWLKKHGKKTKVRVWKMVELSFTGNSLKGPYRSWFRYEKGINKSNCRQEKPSYYHDTIDAGIHVYLDKDRAEQQAGDMKVRIVLSVWVKPSELLGVEGKTAVFKNMCISERIYKKALTGEHKVCI